MSAFHNLAVLMSDVDNHKLCRDVLEKVIITIMPLSRTLHPSVMFSAAYHSSITLPHHHPIDPAGRNGQVREFRGHVEGQQEEANPRQQVEDP